MKKKCEKCGKEFEAYQTHFRFCPNCFSSKKHDTKPLLTDLLLKSYYDLKGNFLKEVFVDVPERLATIFAKDDMATKQLRDFFHKILKARNKALLKGMDEAKPFLYECKRDAAYQLKRGVIPQSFNQFLEYHLPLAEKDEKSLDGFCQHLESIVAYYPKEKGG